MIIYFLGKLFLAPIVNSIIVKISLLPSFWDKFLPTTEGQLLLRALLLAIIFFLLKITKNFVQNAWLNHYILVNQFILIVSVIIFIVTGIIAIFTGSELFGDCEMIVSNYNRSEIISENVVSNRIEFYSDKEVKSSKAITDIHGQMFYDGAQFVHFDANDTTTTGKERFKYSLHTEQQFPMLH